MASKRNAGKERLPPFTPMLNEEIDSKAYREISGTAVKVLILFKQVSGILKKKAGDGFNGIFDFTYTEAQKKGFAKKTFSRAISDLIGKGFIDIVAHGGLRGGGHSNAKYRLSERWRDYGKHVFMSLPRYPNEPVL